MFLRVSKKLPRKCYPLVDCREAEFPFKVVKPIGCMSFVYFLDCHSCGETCDYVAIMAMGYSSRLELNKAGQSENVLDRRKTGYTVRSLGSQGFFASVSPNFRHVYYSHSMDLMTLANALVAKEKDKAKPSAKEVTKAILAKLEKPKKASAAAADPSAPNKASKPAKTELDIERARQKAVAKFAQLDQAVKA